MLRDTRFSWSTHTHIIQMFHHIFQNHLTYFLDTIIFSNLLRSLSSWVLPHKYPEWENTRQPLYIPWFSSISSYPNATKNKTWLVDGPERIPVGQLGFDPFRKTANQKHQRLPFFFWGGEHFPEKNIPKVLIRFSLGTKLSKGEFLWVFVAETTSWATHLPWNLQGRIYFVWKVLLRLGKHNQKSSKAFEEFLHITGVFYIHYIPYIYIYLPVVGGWTNPLEKIWSSKWETIFPK